MKSTGRQYKLPHQSSFLPRKSSLYQETWPDSYLLAWVPNHMLDILGMGVEDTDTFILILFINCGRK
jgi:hypothetical protein